MEYFIVEGGKPLNGEVKIGSAKNAVLPIIACCIMSKEEIIIKDVPKINDVCSMLEIINNIGGVAEFRENDIYINCIDANPKLIESDLTGKIRSSIFILGPILARFRYAKISYPGGCDIGLRPIDLHILGLKTLNVKISEANGMIICDGESMRSSTISLDFPSVGATENLMMAAVLTSGKTIIRNAAREPEIIDLQNFINHLGGKVYGAGTDTVYIEGVKSLKGGEYRPIADRIIASTYLSACAMCGGSVTIKNINSVLLDSVLDKFKRAGCIIIEKPSEIMLISNGKLRALHKIETQGFPGFPTDMQPQITAMLSIADGSSLIVENMFENRFKYTMQLVKMGANITVKDRVAIVKGVKQLNPSVVKAEDLRGGAALVVACLATEGTSEITDIHHIDRGYFRIEDDLKNLGASIKRVSAS